MSLKSILVRLMVLAAGVFPLVIYALLITTDFRFADGKLYFLGYFLLALGLFVSLANFYCSFLRYWVQKYIFKNDEPNNVSGIPLIGVITLVGAFFIPRSSIVNVLVSLHIVLDTGSLTWFACIIWGDKSFFGEADA